MKRLFTCVLLLGVLSEPADSQIIETRSASTSTIFSQEQFEIIPLRRNFNLASLKLRDDVQDSKQSTMDVNVETTYFIFDNFGIHAQFRYDRQEFENGLSALDRSYTANIGGLYGAEFGSNFYLYGLADLVFGSEKQEVTSGSNTIEQTGNKFGFRFEVGSPLPLYDEINLVPQVGYKRYTVDYDDGEEKWSGFYVGVRFNSYLRCADMWGSGSNEDLYDAGSSFFSYPVGATYRFGKVESEFGTVTNENDEKRLSIGGSYNYYVIDNLALGIEARYKNDMQEINPEYRIIQRDFMASGRVTFNMPFHGNFALGFEGGYGIEKSITKIMGNENESKYNVTTWKPMAMYNIRLSPNITITPSLEYRFESIKPDNSDNKEKYGGVVLSAGLYTWLNRR